MLNRTETRPLFAIQLKVNEDILDIEVLESDDRQSLTERVCRDNRIAGEYKKLLEGKIIEALQKLIQRQQMNPALKEKVQRFINRNTELPQLRIQTITTEPNNHTSGSLSGASPIKVRSPQKNATPVRSKQNAIESSSSHLASSQKKAGSPSPNRYRQPIWNLYCHRIPNQIAVVEEQAKRLQNKPEINKQEAQNIPVDRKSSAAGKQEAKGKPAGIKKQNTTLAYKTTVVTKQANNTTTSSSTITKPAQTNVPEKKVTHKKTLTEADEDLIKAYKVVVAKCKDPEMKSMAKGFLERLNRSFIEASPHQSQRKSRSPPAKEPVLISSNKNPPEDKQRSTERAQNPAAVSFQSSERLKRLQALQQPAVPGQFYEEKLNNYVQEKYERLPPSRLSPTRVQPPSTTSHHVGLSTGDPLIDQPYERKYCKESATRSPYEYLNSKYPSVGNTIHRSSTGNINKSSECSPFVSHSNRYHYQTSLESVQEAGIQRHSSQPYHLDNKYRSTSTNPIRRYRYLQEE